MRIRRATEEQPTSERTERPRSEHVIDRDDPTPPMPMPRRRYWRNGARFRDTRGPWGRFDPPGPPR